jgi:acetylornithine deacetylase/succinyl-diaminopimelate desuccinylase-like protein
MTAPILDELLEWLRIPSISTGGGDPKDLERAAEWAASRVRAAGGTADLVRIGTGNPLVVGDLRASAPDAPTVLIYGHYDVQGPGELALWSSDPFRPEIRDGRLYARGASDDKGNFLPLLHVACALAREGALPVHVRVLIEGEEEASSHAVAEWIRADERRADCAIVFDSDMADPRTPAITLGLRGIVMTQVDVRVAPRDLHSGIYGGTVANALHVLHGMLAAVVPAGRLGTGSRVREELREGIVAPDPAELASWERLPAGADELAAVGANPVGDPGAFHLRTGADASLDVNEIRGGEPRTLVPATAHATLSLRLAARQDPARMADVLTGLLREAAPPYAEVEIATHQAAPALFDASHPSVALATEAIERAVGVAPVLTRSGGSIPAVAELAHRGIPTIVSGFALAEDRIHSPDESFRLESLQMGERSARELYAALAALPPSP